MIYFYGDPHFGSENIILFDKRPFKNATEMDYELINLYNSVVSNNDEVYFTGDFGADGYEKEILNKLNGYKYLIKGNHDAKTNQEYRNFGFIEVYDHPIILDDFYMISHEPLYVSKQMPYANIFAHVHTNPMYIKCSIRSFCTCIDRNDYKPVSFDYIKNKIAESVITDIEDRLNL